MVMKGDAFRVESADVDEEVKLVDNRIAYMQKKKWRQPLWQNERKCIKGVRFRFNFIRSFIAVPYFVTSGRKQRIT